MSKMENWTAPRGDAVLATYRIMSGKLHMANPQQNETHRARARLTLALWKAAQAFPDVAMMVVNSQNETSLGICNGGIIVEGQSKLNIGLFRATTRDLSPVEMPLQIRPPMPTKDRFRRAFWAVISQLSGSVLPRVFEYKFGGTTGIVHAQDERLRFSGDCTTPDDFVAELRAASEVEDDVTYTLLRFDGWPDGNDCSVTDLIGQIAAPSDKQTSVFDLEGWPLQYDARQSASVICDLSTMASAINNLGTDSELPSVTLLSGENRSIVSFKPTADQTLEARLT